MHLNRDYDHRRALKRNLMKSFLEHGFIRTTKSKVKFVRPDIEKLIKLAKIGDLNARRKLIAAVSDKDLVSKLLVSSKVFEKRAGGYTRVANLGKRVGDMADMVRLEWVEKMETVKKEKMEDGKGDRKEVRKERENKKGLKLKKQDRAEIKEEKKNEK